MESRAFNWLVVKLDSDIRPGLGPGKREGASDSCGHGCMVLGRCLLGKNTIHQAGLPCAMANMAMLPATAALRLSTVSDIGTVRVARAAAF